MTKLQALNTFLCYQGTNVHIIIIILTCYKGSLKIN